MYYSNLNIDSIIGLHDVVNLLCNHMHMHCIHAVLLVFTDLCICWWFGWRWHFGHVAEFAELVALALNGAVVAE